MSLFYATSVISQICLSLAILESVSLARVICYMREDIGTGGVMSNNAIAAPNSSTKLRHP